MKPQFSAPFDTLTKVLSIVLMVIVIGVTGWTRNMAIIGFGLVAIALAYAWSPGGYTVRNGELIVHRLIGNVTIPLTGLREVRRAEPGELLRALRLWGSGGAFGYYGLFQMWKVGRATWYVTTRANAIVVITATKNVVVSPGDVDGFLAVVHV